LAEQRHFICITCPVGCNLEATVEGNDIVALQGQACKRGAAFVREELRAPKRMLTTTVRIEGGTLPLLPVRSAAPLPKGMILQVAQLLRQVRLKAPVAEGQVILANVLDTGVDIIASRDLPQAGQEEGAPGAAGMEG
jgi:CxxC motif-containing protein